jgi:hypothetical protein
MKLPRIPPASANPASPSADAAAAATQAQQPAASAVDPMAPAARAERLGEAALAPRARLDASSFTAGAALPHVVSRSLEPAERAALIARTVEPREPMAIDEVATAMNALAPRAGDALRARIAATQRDAMSQAGRAGGWLEPQWWKGGATVSVPRLEALRQVSAAAHANATTASVALREIMDHGSQALPLFQVRKSEVSTAHRHRVSSAAQFARGGLGGAATLQHPSRADTGPGSAGAPATFARDAMEAAGRVVASITDSASLHVAHAPWLEALSFLARKTGS